MTALHNELNALQRSLTIQKYLFLLMVLLAFIMSGLAYKLGEIKEKQAVISRGSKLIDSNKPCYDSTDLEIVIFGEPQQ